ncbi:MAG: GNAT family N-acetyltransferase [Acidimicrobiia bacterium]|nr:GNAT family N-acetyltransferase [Acidimicrobiia bacterium]
MTGDWGPDRVGDLVALTDAALPAERLSADELTRCLWDDPADAAVLGDAGAGAVAVVVRHSVGYLRLLVVAPERQGSGLGRELLEAGEAWLRDRGVNQIQAGAEAPFYLWPGVPIEATEALALLESAGYEDSGAAFDMVCPTDLRIDAPVGVQVRLVSDPEAVRPLVDREWPWWWDEVARAIELGTCVGAFSAEGTVLGFGCHSVNRAGWLGPIGTDPAAGRRGIGGALMAGLCADMRERGHTETEICWIGPIGFYAKACGARISRVFQYRVKKTS